MSTSKNIRVYDRNDKLIGDYNGYSGSETVESFKKHLIKNCETVKRRKIGTERVRLTIDSARGAALQDKRKTIHDYCPSTEVKLYFKDLGMQISWKAVFLIEYFGPILITAILALF